MEFGAGTPLEDFRREVREFVAAHAPRFKVRAGVRSPEDEGELKASLRWTAELYAAGYLGADWPERFGGVPDHDPLRDVVVREEIARARAPMPGSGSDLAAHALIGFGREAQRQTYLPAIRAGEQLWCQLFSEPDAGSDLASLRTSAVKDGDDWVINGQKVWTTNGHWADLGYLLARTDPDAPKHKGISAFVLDMRAPGVQVRPLRELTGTSDFNEVFFDQVRVPAEAMIGKPGQGWAIANTSLAQERHGVGASVVSVEMAWEDLVETARALKIDGRPAIDLEDVRQQLAAFRAEVDAVATLAHASLMRWSAGKDRITDAPMAKLGFSELNLRLAEYAVSLLGERGVLTEGDDEAVDEGRWQDAYLYARAYTIAGGSSEVMRNIIAERGLGLPREPR
ncbi:acyl-CoA dehydrogenase family protein [Actinomadura sp. NPDC048394]|uniref:acyl-CoA dehydrogenase family protein n=1 Tax=Actinomadura sp. NPDC048394 TaxID=3158223 RepID=UPI0034076F48